MQRILIDAREFIPNRSTGIGRFLGGLINALAESNGEKELALITFNKSAVFPGLRHHKKIQIISVPASFLGSEKALSDLSHKNFNLFISPYPKLPLFGVGCKAIHTIHDVLDLTHPVYKKRFRVIFDKYRLRSSLKKAALTWYVSSWSLKETKSLIGFTGINPYIRYNALDEKFTPQKLERDGNILDQLKLKPGYILVVGNGLPHKNLGILLRIAGQLDHSFVFIGVSKKRQKFWKSHDPKAQSRWIEHVLDEDLASVIRGAFCLAQPSTAEGYGYPPLEAMACGIPSVVSNIPVLEETTGGNAIMASPANPGEWVQAFSRLQDRNVYQSQVEKGLKWVEPMQGRKGWIKHIADIEGLMRNL